MHEYKQKCCVLNYYMLYYSAQALSIAHNLNKNTKTIRRENKSGI